ncbi:beta-microseminoprotein [Microcaecilia unicolor]|uniref:Beta-microseminoprotein-like n=1 Tax=Microcaecilia unicolor TaxID=1415580 RepID=A0A6P7XZH5_9AMPH|nr:beta-microseminoprotein-like [Microcaecilia unicolor]
MKGFLVVTFAVVFVVIQCNAQCIVEPVQPQSPNKLPEGCVDKKNVIHKIGSSWNTTDCYTCNCLSHDNKVYLSCCGRAIRPSGFDEKHCELIFDQTSCTYSVVEKEDHSKHCSFGGVVVG